MEKNKEEKNKDIARSSTAQRENCEGEQCFCGSSSEHGSLKNELMQAMYKFKSVGRRSRSIGNGYVHRHGHHGLGPHGKGRFHADMHGTFDINPGEMFFIKEIIARKSSGESSGNWLTSMSEYLHISKAAVSQMLGSLEKKGFITRVTNPENRREIIVSVTKEGEKRVDEIQRLFDEKTDMFIERFGVDDTKELIRLIGKMTDVLEEVFE